MKAWKLTPLGFIATWLAAAPALAQTPPPTASGEEVYKAVCFECHGSGKENAPRLGDRKAWASRIREGQATLTAEGWLGERAMPPRGGKPDLAQEAFARAVAYMARAGGAAWKDPDDAMMGRIRAAEKRLAERRQAKKK